MEKSIMERLYQIIIKGLPLTIKNLLEHDLTQEDIKNLIDKNIIKQIECDEFQLLDLESLYNHGIKLFLTKRPKDAPICFSKCFELDSSNRKYCLQLMYHHLRLGQIAAAFEYFPHLEQISEEKDIYDNDLYLYLFNMLTKCPEEYRERVRNMDYDSFLFPYDMQIPFKKEQNHIRQLIAKNKLKKALYMHNNIIAKNPRYSVSNEILKEFIIRLINLEIKFKENILNFVKNKNYHAVISFLDTKSKKRYLTNEETFVYLISKAIIEISDSRIVPPVIDEDTNNLYTAIKGNNYELALEIEVRTLKDYGQNIEENVVFILLTQINELIYGLDQSKQEPQELPKTYTKI